MPDDRYRRIIIERRCGYRECDRKAARGWTTCIGHYSAGVSLKHWSQGHARREGTR